MTAEGHGPVDTSSRGVDRRTWPAALVAVAGGIALGLPPEVHPLSGVLLALILAPALWVAVPAPGIVTALCVVGLGGFHFAVSLAPGRSLGVVAGWVLALAAFWAARGAGAAARAKVPLVLALIGAGLGLLALAQRLGLMALDAAAARRLGLPAEMILRLEHGRVFGTHVVPAALAGALVLAGLAAVAVLADRGSSRPLVIACLPLILLGLVLTASLGAWLGLVVGLAAVLVVTRRRVAPRWRVLGGAAAVVLALALVALRPVDVADLSRPDNPLRLRLGNWRGAVLMATAQPVTGTGLGSFGALYPRYRRAGDSETLYAHNSWLQIAAEGGWPALALLCAAAVFFFRRWRGVSGAGDGLWLLAALLAFVVHNLVDFTAYLPGVAVPAAILAGMVFARPGASDRPPTGAAPFVARAIALVLLLAAGGWWSMETASRGLMDRAMLEAAERPVSAAEVAARAARIAPWSTSRTVTAGNLLLAAGDRRSLAVLGGLLQVPLRLDSASPAPWHLLARWRLARGEVSAAWEAYRLAAIRHPAASAIRRQIEAIERAFDEKGLIGAESVPAPGEGSVPASAPAWQPWDDTLVLVGGLILLVVAVSLRRSGLVGALAVALSLVCLISAFGEGGALPGVRLVRAVVVAFAVLAWLLARSPEGRGRWPAWGGGAALVLGAWAALAAACAPAPLAARDGWLSLLTAGAILGLSFFLARENPHWIRICLTVVAAAAGLEAGLWLVQKGLLAAGVAVASRAPPLGTPNPLRPAGDFLHPGHLGTFLVVGAAALLGAGIRVSRGRALLALLLVFAGLSGGSRASLLALVAAGGVFASCASSRRLRRAVTAVVVVALVFGAAVVVWRLGYGDPYAWTRTRIWRAALEALFDRPWLGFGPGGFGPLAPRWSFEDPGSVARWSRTFSGPHSDPLALLLALGLPAGLVALALGGLGWCRAWAAARRAGSLAPVAALAAVSALLAHGLVDDLFSERPATWVVASLLAGVCLAGVARDRSGWVFEGCARRRAVALAVILAVVAGEVLPWAADRAFRAGRPEWALRLEPRSGRYALALLERPVGSLAHVDSSRERALLARRMRPYDPPGLGTLGGAGGTALP
ncbi:MAG: O-antigen ligase family protein [Acidobacteriota bacterium]|nr:O-antigen ligase family protein [Acidobacteriota bacterium]